MNKNPNVNGFGLPMLEIIADIILTPSIWINVYMEEAVPIFVENIAIAPELEFGNIIPEANASMVIGISIE